MEKFMFLFRSSESPAQNTQDPKPAIDNMQAWMKWMQALAEKGILAGGEPLLPTGKQVNGSGKVVSDGPFIESKEIVSGFLIVKAKDIDEAVEISKDCPIFLENGKLEVRPVQKLEM